MDLLYSLVLFIKVFLVLSNCSFVLEPFPPAGSFFPSLAGSRSGCPQGGLLLWNRLGQVEAAGWLQQRACNFYSERSAWRCWLGRLYRLDIVFFCASFPESFSESVLILLSVGLFPKFSRPTKWVNCGLGAWPGEQVYSGACRPGYLVLLMWCRWGGGATPI